MKTKYIIKDITNRMCKIGRRSISKLIPMTMKTKIINLAKKDIPSSEIVYNYKIQVLHTKRAEGKTVMVTGGTGAIGSAICLRMALEGAVVGICGRSKEKIDSTIKVIKGIYTEAKLIPIVLDVLNEENIESAIKTFIETYKKLDVLINNAGGGNRDHSKPLREQNIVAIDNIINTNLRGAILCSRVASSIMVKQKFGKIISMSSVMGINGKENWTEYSSSKSGILGMTKSLALELGEYNITVNAISPGMVQQIPFDHGFPIKHTDTNSLKRFGYTDEVAYLVAFLCSDEANYITGQNFVIDGGRSIGLK